MRGASLPCQLEATERSWSWDDQSRAFGSESLERRCWYELGGEGRDKGVEGESTREKDVMMM